MYETKSKTEAKKLRATTFLYLSKLGAHKNIFCLGVPIVFSPPVQELYNKPIYREIRTSNGA